MTLHCADESRRPDDNQRRCFAAQCGSAAPRAQDLVVLRSNLEQADAGVLVAVLAQLSGDPGWSTGSVRRSPTFPDPRSNSVSPIRRPGGAGGEIVAILTGEVARAGKCARDDPELFARIAPASGSAVRSPSVPLLLEQGGFQEVPAHAAPEQASAQDHRWRRSSVAAWPA